MNDHTGVLLVVVVGVLAMAALALYPPWVFDGIYRGHSSLFRTMFMSVDTKRWLLEEGGLLAATLALAVLFRRR